MASKKRKRHLARSTSRLLSSAPMLYRFANCELDARLYQLRRDGAPVAIEPRVFDVLVYLLNNRDHVVSKDELLDKLWTGQVVTETALTRCIVAARKAVGDDGTKQTVIETQHGRGYRFVATVTEQSEVTTSSPSPDGIGSVTVTDNGQSSETIFDPLPLPYAQEVNEHEVNLRSAPEEVASSSSPSPVLAGEGWGESQVRHRRLWLRGLLGMLVVGLGVLVIKTWPFAVTAVCLAG